MFTSLAAFAAAAALVLGLVGCGELFETPDTLRHAALMMTALDNLKTCGRRPPAYGRTRPEVLWWPAFPAAEPGAIDEKAAEVIAEVERQKAEREEAGS